MLTFRYSQCHSSLSCVTITALQMDFIWRGTAASRVNDKDGMVKSQVLDRLYWAGGCPFTLALICSNNTEFLPTKQLCHLAWSGQLGVVLPQRKTLLTDHLLLRRQICPVTFTFSLPKPIKHLMCLVIISRPIMEISTKKKKKNHLSYPDSCSYLVLLSEGHRLPWSFFSQYVSRLAISVLCVPPDLREIVFVLQSQSNSYHERQAERQRADLLKQAHGLTEVRVETFSHTQCLESRHRSQTKCA